MSNVVHNYAGNTRKVLVEKMSKVFVYNDEKVWYFGFGNADNKILIFNKTKQNV